MNSFKKYATEKTLGDPCNSGVYLVRNIHNEKVYVGSAINLLKRKNKHFSDLSRGKHDNRHLQFSYNKYGKEYFVFEILIYLEDFDKLVKTEQYYIDLLDATNPNRGYNIRKIAESNLGIIRSPFSEETKKKMSESKKGNKNRLGTHHTEESKKKLSESAIGRIWTEEQRKSFSEIQKGHFSSIKGKPRSEEIKNKISLSHLGVKRPGDWAKGSNNPKAKINETIALEIKRLIYENVSRKDIAKIFDISYDIVSRIATGKSWSNINYEPNK